MNRVSNGKINPQPTYWQRTGSRALSWIYSHIFNLSSRKAFAGSLREESSKLNNQDEQRSLIRLLVEHKIVQEGFANISPLALQHYHLCKMLTKRKTNEFIAAFNNDECFKGKFVISPSAGQFSIVKKEEAIDIDKLTPELAQDDLPPNVTALVWGSLMNANRPLTLSQIRADIKKRHPAQFKKISHNQISLKIGEHVGKGSLLETYAEAAENVRYFAPHRITDMLNKNTFEYIDAKGDKHYILNKDAAQLARQRKAHKILQQDGSFIYMNSGLLVGQSKGTISVKTKHEQYYILVEDKNALIESGHIIRGCEDNSFAQCFIDTNSQFDFRFEIFNAFAHAYLAEPGNINYQRLRTAFEAGTNFANPNSITDFLYEARNVALLNGKPEAVVLALLKTPQATKALETSTVFSREEIDDLTTDLDRLNLLSVFPLLFMPDWSYSLQNYIHHIHDQCCTYNVFLNLLIRKMSELRNCNRKGMLPPTLGREIEMVYAPLAERRGFIDLANNMRDLVSRLVDPKAYAGAQKNLVQAINMPAHQARRHLALITQHIGDDIRTSPALKDEHREVRTSSRLKEIFSLIGKKEIGPDSLGIRLICQNTEQAKYLISYLLTTYELAEDRHGKDAIADHLDEPNKNGWRGWRGYFYDPLQATTENTLKRDLSIQVLTRKNIKADKMGKAGHWKYKAERAAANNSQDRSLTYQKQLFDSISEDEYTGDPEHDFKVDRDHARRHKRVFVIPDPSFSHNSFQFPEDGQIAIHRITHTATVEDVVASQAYDDQLTTNYTHSDLYQCEFDYQKKALRFIPYKPGTGRAPAGEVPPNGCFLIPRNSGTPINAYVLAELLSKVQSVRAKLLIKLDLETPKSNEALREERQESSLAQLLDTREKQQEVIRKAGLAPHDLNELWLALAFKLIDENMIRDWLGILDVKINWNFSNKSINFSLDGPDKLGLLHTILSKLASKFSILSAKVKTDQSFFGVSPVNINLSLRDNGGMSPSLSTSALQQEIALLPFPQHNKFASSTKINLHLPNLRKNKDWDIINKLISRTTALSLNIIEVNLPDVKGQVPGRIVLEGPEDFELSKLNQSLEDLREAHPNIKTNLIT